MFREALILMFSEPSLALFRTHGCTFYVRPFPSGYLIPWTGARGTGEGILKALRSREEAGDMAMRNSPASLRAERCRAKFFDLVIYVS